VRRREEYLKKWIAKLKDKDWDVRWTAARILGRLNDKRAIAPLMKALADKNWVVRWEVTEVLGEIGDTSLVQPLITILAGKPTYLRVNAAWILGKIGDPRSVDPLIQALEDPNWFGRALGEIGDYRAIKPLIKALADIEPSVHDAAEMAIKKIFASVKTVLFGYESFTIHDSWPAWRNPDVIELTTSLSGLKTIGVHANTYDFHLIERFITYAVNYIGQKHLKKHVEVQIYGDPNKLHPNLRNTFTNLCKCVEVHEGD
jgi:hypothetical protein